METRLIFRIFALIQSVKMVNREPLDYRMTQVLCLQNVSRPYLNYKNEHEWAKRPNP